MTTTPHIFLGEKIFAVAWEIIESLELYNIPVVSLTSDGAKPNRRFYRMCQMQSKGRKIPYQTVNPYQRRNRLFFFCDVPHLLKTARNCFSNSFAHSCSRKMQVQCAISQCFTCYRITDHCRKMGNSSHGSGLRVFSSRRLPLTLQE